MAKDKDKPVLTVKQKKFADLYIELGNATEAAIKAGYSEKTAKAMGYENLTKPYIKQYIDEIMVQKDKEAIASQDEILSYLTAVMRGNKREQTLIGIGMGEQRVTEIDVGSKDRIKAAELLGKRYGMWTDKLDVTGAMVVNIVDDVDDLEDDDEDDDE
jgi:phage terminase small subunit